MRSNPIGVSLGAWISLRYDTVCSIPKSYEISIMRNQKGDSSFFVFEPLHGRLLKEFVDELAVLIVHNYIHSRKDSMIFAGHGCNNLTS